VQVEAKIKNEAIMGKWQWEVPMHARFRRRFTPIWVRLPTVSGLFLLTWVSRAVGPVFL
jgi:hypothetical protein